MRRTILTAALIVATGCATTRPADEPTTTPTHPAAPAAAPEAGLPQLLGIAVLKGNTGVLCTAGPGPRPGQKITVVLPDAGKHLPALALAEAGALQGKRACHMDDTSEATLTKLFLKDRKETTPAVGIGVLRSGEAVQLDAELKVDLDADGMKESFKTCTSSEGVHATVWTGEPQKGIRRWHAYYYLSHDTEASCTAGET